MEQSPQIDQLTAALVKAAAKFKPLTPDKTNPHFKSRFASLEQCIAVTRPALIAEGVFVTQFMEPAPDGFLGVTTQIQCGDQWQRSVLYMPAQPTPQGAGSAITYARRYSYCAALGLAPDEDDDAEGAQERPQAPVSASQPPGVPTGGYKRSGAYRLGTQNRHGYGGMTFEEVWNTGPEGESYVRKCAHFDGGSADMRNAAREVLDAHTADDNVPF